MGARFSSKKRPEKQKRPRQYGKVNNYLLEPTRKRPRTSKSLRDAKFIATLGQQGRSATMFELNKEKEKPVIQTIPRWQSKWEIDMRPDPSKDHINTLQTWKSMPLPTTERASAESKASPLNRSIHSRKSKKSRTREKRGTLGRLSSGALPPVEDTEKIDIQSVASYRVDDFKMLHKTDDRTQSLLDLTARLWHIEPKKHNKSWFLGPDSKNVPEPTVSFENMPRQSKPFTTFVNLVRPLARIEHNLNKHENTVAKHETIIEEE
ncbi:uncharacterized protein LOC123557222 [Mercenaria mercenaria]|uniref:uncharacterized protein LOC123557222 n=1 Tax=Mercenaria mercenaria TaxID=6596 RepID=UPI00234F9E62|nr:uncharacterized protein LOC123557222 [Mercenaria mercenaria]